MKLFKQQLNVVFVGMVFCLQVQAQVNEQLIPLLLSKGYVKAQQIRKMEADVQQQDSALVLRCLFDSEGRLIRYQKLYDNRPLEETQLTYDQKGRRLSERNKNREQTLVHKITYSKDNSFYESISSYAPKKWWQIFGSNYRWTYAECYGSLDSLNRVEKSLTHLFKRGKEDYHEEISRTYTYEKEAILEKELYVDVEQGTQKNEFHTYVWKKDESGKVNYLAYAFNETQKTIYQLSYHKEYVVIKNGENELKLWIIP